MLTAKIIVQWETVKKFWAVNWGGIGLSLFRANHCAHNRQNAARGAGWKLRKSSFLRLYMSFHLEVLKTRTRTSNLVVCQALKAVGEATAVLASQCNLQTLARRIIFIAMERVAETDLACQFGYADLWHLSILLVSLLQQYAYRKEFAISVKVMFCFYEALQ
jgi:hypothetical protein